MKLDKRFRLTKDGKIERVRRGLSVSDRIRERFSKRVQVKKKSPEGLNG